MVALSLHSLIASARLFLKCSSAAGRDAMRMKNSAHILIAEDERLVARDLERRLQRLGYTVVALAATGCDAIHQAVEHRPDLVMMDIHLRGEMDGIEAAGFIRSRLNTRIVYMSAYSDQTTLARAQSTDPAAFLEKPFNDCNLQRTLQQVLCQ
jgi:CheY-like chemotaxis protein